VLARIRKAMEEREEGFTLIELLVVIIIIGILAAIAIPVFLNQRKKAQNAAIKSDLRTVANEEETFFTDQQTYTNVPSGGAAPTLNQITYSNGVKVTAAASGTAYCLKGYNANSDVTGGATGKFYWYDSQIGGLQSAASATAPTGGACAGFTAAQFAALN